MDRASAIDRAPDLGARSRGAWFLLRLITIGAVGFTLGNATWAAWDQDITYDEPYHLRWAQRLGEERNDGREEFRFDSKTPALLPAVLLRRALVAAGIKSEQVLTFSTRVPSVILLAGLLWLVARLAQSSNPATWWIGLLLAALDANLAAQASIATTDLAYSVVVLLLALAIAGGNPSKLRAGAIGAVLGAAFAVKFTAVLLLPVAVLALAFRPGSSAKGRLLQLALALGAACLTVSALYLWVGVFQPLNSISFESPTVQKLASTFPSLRLPLPRGLLTGLDASMAHNDPGLWVTYLLGHEHPGGVWYYFLANWLIKTPVALLVALLYGLWRIRHSFRELTVIVLGALFVVHLAYFSFMFATQIGLRFALPCVALGCALAARGLRDTHPRWLLVVAVLALGERAPYWGDPIAFTNLSVWPKSRAYWYTADSNLDYGQNRQRLGRYAKATGLALVMDQATVTPGLYVAGANQLVVFDSRRSHRWLVENNVPAINVGFTHFAFSITGDRFDRYLDEARLAASQDGRDGLCAPPLPHYAPGDQIPFEQTVNPVTGRWWLICARSRKGVDLGFRVNVGRAAFGRVTREGACEADLLQVGQQSWYRIPGGVEARLCLQEIPFRRSVVPYRLSGYLTVRGQGADVEFREATFGQRPPNASGQDPSR